MVAAAIVLIVFFRTRWHDLRSARAQPKALGPVAGWAMFVGMLILQQVGMALALRAWGIDTTVQPLSLHSQAKLLLGAYAAQMIGVIVFVTWNARRDQSASPTPRFGVWQSIAVGALAMGMLWPVLVALTAIIRPLFILFTGSHPPVIAHDTLRLLLENPVNGWYVTLVATALIVAPVVEEVTYRGILQASLAQAFRHRWLAIIVTSLIFAAAHGTVDAHALPVLFVLSLAFGWAYERTGRLSASIVMHVLFNVANLALALLTHAR